MKSLIKTTVSFLAIASLLTSAGAFAEPARGDRDWQKGPPRAEEKLAHFSRALSLSDEQSAEMLAIFQEQNKNQMVLHKQTMAIMGAEICAQRAQTEEAMLSILDAEQTELFLQMKEDRLAMGEGRMRSRNGRSGMDCDDFDVDE